MLSPPDHTARANTLIDIDATAADLARLRDIYAGREREMRTAMAQRLKSSLAEGRAAAEQMLLKDRHGRKCAERLCVMQDDIIRMLFDLVGKQQPLDAGAAVRERATQVARDRQSQLARVAGVDFGQALEFGRDANRIEKFGFPGRLSQGQHGFMAIAKRGRRVIPNRAAWAHIVSPCGEDSVLPRTGPE